MRVFVLGGTGSIGSALVRELIERGHDVWGLVFIRRVRSIGSIRRECLDHIVVFGERHLRHVLLFYMDYYNGTRTHLSLSKDAPISRAEAAGSILCRPILGGLLHQYARA